MTHIILVVDDEKDQAGQTQQIIADKLGYRALVAHSGREVVERFLLRSKPAPDLVLMHLMMTDMSGMDVIRAIRRSDPQLPIIVLAAQQDMRYAAEAIRAGANDFLLKPVTIERLKLSLNNVLQRVVLSHEVDRLSRHLHGQVQCSDMIGHSASVANAQAVAKRVTNLSTPMVIEGEGGTGKELLAQVIHGSGMRAGRPFVSVNCAAMREADVAVSLYGGVDDQGVRVAGKFAEAEGGTLFLKHVDALPLEHQATLARRIGRPRYDHESMNVRVIAALSQPLAEVMKQGEFHDGLCDVLSCLRVWLAPLRERKDDIALLAEHFIRRYGAREGKTACYLTNDALHMLRHYHWPGNVRELRHVMVRAIMQAGDAAITPKLLIALLLGQLSSTRVQELPEASPLYAFCSAEELSSLSLLSKDGNVRCIHELEAEMIQYAIRLYKGKMSEVARRLGIGRSTLYRKIQDYNINHAA